MTTTKVKGAFKHTVKNKGTKQELSIKVKVGKGGLITADNFDEGVVKAVFPDGVVCELESDDSARRFYEFSLKLRVKKAVYTEKDGSCEMLDRRASAQIPDYAGNPIDIVFDSDDDASTPDVEIATGIFNP